jgi:hypothetical protein
MADSFGALVDLAGLAAASALAGATGNMGAEMVNASNPRVRDALNMLQKALFCLFDNLFNLLVGAFWSAKGRIFSPVQVVAPKIIFDVSW